MDTIIRECIVMSKSDEVVLKKHLFIQNNYKNSTIISIYKYSARLLIVI